MAEGNTDNPLVQVVAESGKIKDPRVAEHIARPINNHLNENKRESFVHRLLYRAIGMSRFAKRMHTPVAEEIATEAIRSEDQAEKDRLRDELTGLYNKKGLEEQYKRKQADIDAKGGTMTVFFTDLDNFKEGVNDQFGHKAGDSVINTVGHILDKASRDDDPAARLSGDEMSLLVSNAPEGFAENFRKRVQQRLLQSSFNVTGLSNVGMSIGCATYKAGDGISLDTLLSRADTAMYHAKALGKAPGLVKLVPWEPSMIKPPSALPGRT